MRIKIDQADKLFRKKRGKFIICTNCKKSHYRSLSRIDIIRHSGLNYFCSRDCRKGFDLGEKVAWYVKSAVKTIKHIIHTLSIGVVLVAQIFVE